MNRLFSRLLAALMCVALLVPQVTAAQVAIDPGARGMAARGDPTGRAATAAVRDRQNRYISAILAGAQARDAAKEYLQTVTTNNEIDRVVGSATTSGNVKQVTRRLVYMGQYDASQLIASLSSFVLPVPSTIETDGPAFVARGQIEVNGICAPLTFGGASSISVSAGGVDVQSDAVSPGTFGLKTFQPGTPVYYLIEREYVVGAIPTYTALSGAGAGEITMRAASGTASKIGTCGDLATGGGWTSTAAYYGADILGIPVTNVPSFGILGASIEDGSTDVNNSSGYIRRAMMLGNKIAFLNVAKSSDAGYIFITSYAKRRALFKYITVALNAYGGNDFTDNKSAATTAANLATINRQLKEAGVKKVYQIRLYPKTDSTDGWTTLAGQTVRTNSSAVSFTTWRAQVEAAAAADPNCDGIIDITSMVESQSEPGKWLPNMTADGTHPTAATHALMAPAFRTKIDVILAQPISYNIDLHRIPANDNARKIQAA